jgi:hypothetical protein
MKLTVLVFVLIAAGVTAGRATVPSQAVIGSTAISSIQANSATTLVCCGGPLCIPHEPCGSGGPKLI